MKRDNDRIDRQRGHRIPIKHLRALKEALAAAKLDNASFGFPDDRVRVVREHCGQRDGAEMHPDAYIKEAVRIHHHSWIISPLEDVIAWAEGKDK